MTRKCHVDDSAEGKYGMILGRYLLIALGLGINFYEHIIISGAGTYEGCLEAMVDIKNYGFKNRTDKTIKVKDFFSIGTSTKALIRKAQISQQEKCVEF